MVVKQVIMRMMQKLHFGYERYGLKIDMKNTKIVLIGGKEESIYIKLERGSFMHLEMYVTEDMLSHVD